MIGRVGTLFVVVLASVVLAACAGTEGGKPPVQSANTVSVVRATSPNYDFVVSVPDVKGPQYDPSDKAARESMALAALKNDCEAPEIIGESIVSSGTFLLGDQSRVYAMQVRC